MIDLVAFIFGLRVSDWHTGRIGIGPALRDGEDLFFSYFFFQLSIGSLWSTEIAK
jgi:hypothetical protein